MWYGGAAEDPGAMVSGQIKRGVIRVGDRLQLVGSGAEKYTVVTSLFSYYADSSDQLRVARAGDEVILNLRGIRKDEIKRGMALATPGSITREY